VAVVLIGLLLPPLGMYMQLVMGYALPHWMTLLAFVAIMRWCRQGPTRHEMILVLAVVSAAVGMVAGKVLEGLLFRQYLVQSPAARSFEIAGHVPAWAVPPPSSEAYKLRALFHREWWTPIALVAVGLLWSSLNFYSLGYVLFRMTSDLERLPFPLAAIHARGVAALAESDRKTRRWRCFVIGAGIGMAFSLLSVGLPLLTDSLLKTPIQLIPTCIDRTRSLQGIRPAACVVVGTNLMYLFVGLVLPFWLVVGAFLSAAGGQLGLNPMLYSAGVLKRWQPGMSAVATQTANSLDFWLSFRAGAVSAIALIGLVVSLRLVLAARRPQGTDRPILPAPAARGDVSIVGPLVFYVASTLGLIVLCHWLVPGCPVCVLLVFGFAYTPLVSYATARLMALGAYGFGLAHLGTSCVALTGYRGVGIWCAPLPMLNAGSAAQVFRELELTGTRPSEAFKALLVCVPVALVSSLLFCSLLWRMGEIPSTAYPYAMRFWPLTAVRKCFWMTATSTGNTFFLEALKPTPIAMGLAYGLGACILLPAVRLPAMLAYGAVVGLGDSLAIWPLAFLGALLGRFHFAKRFGGKVWREYAAILTAGFACGSTMAGLIAVGLRLMGGAALR